MAAVPQILNASGREPDSQAIQQACAHLLRGELVVLPTETVYGVAADPRQPGAMEKLYQAKGRDQDKPVALFPPGIEAITAQGVEMTPALRAAAERFWPGPLTLVLSSPRGNVGFRMPDHPVPLAILLELNAPLAVTSANRSGEPEALTAEQAQVHLGNAVSLILDGGPSQGTVPSTVLRLATGRAIVLREGTITRDELHEVFEPLGVAIE